MAKRGRKPKHTPEPAFEEKVVHGDFFESLGVKNLYGIKQVGNLYRMVKLSIGPAVEVIENVEDLRGIQIGKIVTELESEAQ